MMSETLRPLRWVGSSKKDFRAFPPEVPDGFGFELYLAQSGLHPPSAKPLKGLGSGVIELIEDYGGDAYRAVYAVRFVDAIYVLHCFKKKSKRGIATPQPDIELIRRRLADAGAHHSQRNFAKD